MRARISTDIGGTFTDLVYFDEEARALGVTKAPTTPRDFSGGVLEAVSEAQLDLAQATEFAHGCTVVINAITERRGARTALVTTAGFRDVLEIGRGNRPDMYNLLYHKPEPLVSRDLRFEVRERVDWRGTVVEPLHVEDLDAVADVCRAEGVEAVAICFLHAYAHRGHEEAARGRLAELLPGVELATSSSITGEWREYERTSTTVLNAYTQPSVDRYLAALEEGLGAGGFRRGYFVMQSNGGTASFASARKLPLYLIESGPVAGVIGAARVGVQIGQPNVISLDIGGTTAKCSLIEDGTPKTTTEYKLEWRPDFAGYPATVPVVDIVEIGAGGGSIAWTDTGALRVGPKSAGAEPGPACYGKGGDEPTVTDSKLLAGVINPDYFLGGRLRVHPELAREALARLGSELVLSAEETANGIVRLVNANMINALKLVSVRRGYDPRDFVLVASGGGGPMHAAALGAELQVKNVVVPPNPGVFSAWGMLVTEPRVDAIRTHIMPTDAADPDAVEAVFGELEEEALARFRADDVPTEDVRYVRTADMRYRGQEHTVRVAIPAGRANTAAIEEEFHRAHKRAYTFELRDERVELVTFHVAASRAVATPEQPELGRDGRTPESAYKGTRQVDFDVHGTHTCAVYERELLPPAFEADGPVLVEEPASVTLIHPGQALEVDRFGNLVLHLR